MGEENKDKQGEEKTTDDKDAGDKSELSKQTDAANAAAERMEKATEEFKAAEAKARLGGVTEAGQTQEKKEETPKEYNDRIEKEISEGKHDD